VQADIHGSLTAQHEARGRSQNSYASRMTAKMVASTDASMEAFRRCTGFDPVSLERM